MDKISKKSDFIIIYSMWKLKLVCISAPHDECGGPLKRAVGLFEPRLAKGFGTF